MKANHDMSSVSRRSQNIFHLQRLQRANDILEELEPGLEKLHDLAYLFDSISYGELTGTEIIEAMYYSIVDMEVELSRLAKITSKHLFEHERKTV